MATIIQDYGPIYGEIVNGTVQGRPNGSIYVPLSNIITLNMSQSYLKFDNIRYVNANGNGVGSMIEIVAQSQDLASYIETSIYSDSACTTLVGRSLQQAAGQFNKTILGVALPTVNGVNDLTTGNTYYVRAQLMNNGTPVATSTVYALEAL